MTFFFNIFGEPSRGSFFYYMQCKCCAKCSLYEGWHSRNVFGLGLHDRAVRPLPVIWYGICQSDQPPNLSQSYLGPAITSTCGPLVANHPQWVIAPRRPPKVASVSGWISVSGLTYPLSLCQTHPGLGPVAEKIPIMSDVGFKPTTSRLCARSSNH